MEAPRVEIRPRSSGSASSLRCPTGCVRRRRRFRVTGGLHATGLFAADGELLCVREDVGRHNAMDKVLGWALREGLLPLPTRCSASAAGSPSSSCRRRRSRAVRSWSPSARRRRSRSSSVRIAGSRCVASSATAAPRSTRGPTGSSSDGAHRRASRRRRLGAVRITQGARAAPRRDAGGPSGSAARGGVRRGARRRARPPTVLPFPVLDDGAVSRAPVHGVVAALRHARHDVVVALPVDVPLVTPGALTGARRGRGCSVRSDPAARGVSAVAPSRAGAAGRGRASCRCAASTRRRSSFRRGCCSTSTPPRRSRSWSGRGTRSSSAARGCWPPLRGR